MQDEIFESGFGVENYLSVSGGMIRQPILFLDHTWDNEGIIKNTNFQRIGF
ncbi:hypothetical protein Q2T40_03950 [Winogradskyella maritima]|nr:hypothetical protein [Winogradskyella maritima]